MPHTTKTLWDGIEYHERNEARWPYTGYSVLFPDFPAYAYLLACSFNLPVHANLSPSKTWFNYSTHTRIQSGYLINRALRSAALPLRWVSHGVESTPTDVNEVDWFPVVPLSMAELEGEQFSERWSRPLFHWIEASSKGAGPIGFGTPSQSQTLVEVLARRSNEQCLLTWRKDLARISEFSHR